MRLGWDAWCLPWVMWERGSSSSIRLGSGHEGALGSLSGRVGVVALCGGGHSWVSRAGQSLRVCIFLRVVQDAFRPLGFCPGPTEWGYLRNRPLCVLSQAKPGLRSVRLRSFTLLKAPGPFQTEAFCTARLSLPAWAGI